MDVKAQSERAEHGNGCILLAESQKELVGKVDAIELFKSYATIVQQSIEHPTVREPNGIQTAQLEAFIDFNVTPGVDKVSIVNQNMDDLRANRDLSWVLVDREKHKITRVGCSEGPLEHPKF
jgi:hypothetical protein